MPPAPLAYFTKVGPIDYRDGRSVAIYLALDEDAEILESVVESPPNDAAALRKLVKDVPKHTPCCGLELARLGASLGIEPRDLPSRIAAARAGSAYLASTSPHSAMSLGGPGELGDAGAAYLRAEPWRKLASDVRFAMHATLRDHGRSKTYEVDLLAHVQEGDRPDGPSLELEDDGTFAGFIGYAPGEPSPLRVRVTLAEEPEYVAEAMEAAFGASFYPRVAYTLGGRLMPPDDAHGLLLAGAMRAAASYATGGEGAGRATSGAFEVEVRADFAKALPAGSGPEPLPAGWLVSEMQENGMRSVTAGDVSFDIGAQRREDRRWVNVLFRPHASGKPVSYDEAREVFRLFVGCGRFSEMEMARDGEALPMLGMRIYSAPMATPRPKSAAPVERGDAEMAALVERAKPLLADLGAMARDSRRPFSDFCVVMDAEAGGRRVERDGVVMTRELVEKLFPTRESDPFDLRGRFEEPRPANECVVLVKHESGVEEVHVSLEGVEVGPEGEA